MNIEFDESTPLHVIKELAPGLRLDDKTAELSIPDLDAPTEITFNVDFGKDPVSFVRLSYNDQPLDPPTTEREARFRNHLGRRAARAIEDCEIPTVARIQGHAAGGGCVWAVSCDFRVATTDALFWYPEIELGVPLTWAATPRLLQEIGTARARQMVMLCERVDGRRAEQWGLVHEAVEADLLDEAVQRWVERILAMPETALHMTKTQFRGYGRAFAQGDVSEADGDQIELARRLPGTKERFTAGF